MGDFFPSHFLSPKLPVQLTLDQHGFELQRSAHMQIFFNKYVLQSYTIHSWLNPRMWNSNTEG